MNDFNSLKYNILNNGKWNKINQNLKSQLSSSKSSLRTKQVWLRKNRPNVKVCSMLLKLNLLVNGTLIMVVVDT